MGSRSKGRGREVTTYAYKPRLGRMSRLERMITRRVNRQTYSRELERRYAKPKESK